MQVKQETVQRLMQLLQYDPLTGNVLVRKSKRILQGDSNGQVSVYDATAKPALKRYLLDKLAFALAYEQWPRKDQRILHKNLNPDDNRLCNLALVSRTVFNKIQEAHRNIDYGIKMKAHTTDQYKYIVNWYEDSQVKIKVLNDVVSARHLYMQLKLKYSKILTKYCVFD